MSKIAEQVHGRFKVFTGKLAADNTLGVLATEIEDWVRTAKVAPKSIGVEYLESSKKLILSVGYRDDEAPYNITLTSVQIGRLEALDAPGLAKLEQAMTRASATVKNIICHELYVTESHELLMVFMAHQAG
jgi:hypothetical protein